MEQYLCLYFKHNYYQNIIGYDMVKGFYDLGNTTNSSGIEELINLIRRDQESIQNTGREQPGFTYTLHQFNGQRCLVPDSLEDAAHIIQLVMNYSAAPTGLIIQFASQMVSRPDDFSVFKTWCGKSMQEPFTCCRTERNSRSSNYKPDVPSYR